MTEQQDIANGGDRVSLTIEGRVSLATENHVWITVADEVDDLSITREQWDAIEMKVVRPAAPRWQDGDVVAYYDPASIADRTVQRRDGKWYVAMPGAREPIANPPHSSDDRINRLVDSGDALVLVAEGRPVL